MRPRTFCVSLDVDLFPGDPGFVRQGLQVVPRLHVDDAVQIFLSWRAEDACTQRRDIFLSILMGQMPSKQVLLAPEN